MELVLNLVWLTMCSALLLGAWRAARRGRFGVSDRTAFTAVFAVCMLLLPVISMTDDLLEQHQAALPLAAQTWHMASEGGSIGLELLAVAGACWLLLLEAAGILCAKVEIGWNARPHSAWLTRAQRLRPPPAVAF